MTSQQKRAQTTRQTLIEAFRTSFLQKGFEDTTTQEILRETGMSKGALYHHFQSKLEVLEAIYAEESRSAIARAIVRADTSQPFITRLREGCIAWMNEVRSPETSIILFELGPSALGHQKARAIEDEYSLLHFNRYLEKATEAGEIELGDPQLVAGMLNALVAEAVLYMLRTGKDSSESLANAIDALLESLKPN